MTTFCFAGIFSNISLEYVLEQFNKLEHNIITVQHLNILFSNYAHSSCLRTAYMSKVAYSSPGIPYRTYKFGILLSPISQHIRNVLIVRDPPESYITAHKKCPDSLGSS